MSRSDQTGYMAAGGSDDDVKDIAESAGTASVKALKLPINAGVYKHHCPVCDSTFQKSEHLHRHERSHTKERPFACLECGKKFTRQDSLIRHGRLHETYEGDSVSGPAQRATAERKTTSNGRKNSDASNVAHGASSRASPNSREPRSIGHETTFGTRPPPVKASGDYIHAHLSPSYSKSEDDRVESQGPHKRRRLDSFLEVADWRGTDARRPSVNGEKLSSQRENMPFLFDGDQKASFHEHDATGLPLYALQGPSDVNNSHALGTFSTFNTDERDTGVNEALTTAGPTSALMFATNLESHISGQILEQLRNSSNVYATSYRTPQSDGDSHTTLTPMTVENPGSVKGLSALTGADSSQAFEMPTNTPFSLTDVYPGFPMQDHRNMGDLQNLGGRMQEEESFDFDGNAYALPMGFGIEENSDLDLLQFLASDTSIAFAHTLIPEYTTFTRQNTPGIAGSSTRRGRSHSPVRYPPDGMIDPSLASMSSTNGVDTMQPDFPQHMTLSPKMAALWKNLMTQGSNAPEQTQSLPEPIKAESDREGDQREAIDLRFSSTGAASGQMQPTSYTQQTSSSRLDSVQQTTGSTASDSHFGTEGRRPRDAITEAKHLISDLSFHLSASTSPLSSAFLDKGLKLFFTRFLPVFKIIHQPTWSVKSASAPLIINMIALGSLYMGEEDDRPKGEALWRLVYKGCCISWERLIELRTGPGDPTRGTTLCQTILLGQIYATLAERNSLRASPYTFQGFGLRIARLAGIFRLPKAAADEFLPNDGDCSQAELETAFRTWAAYESQLRAVLSLYVVEGQFVQLYRVPPTSSHLTNPFVSACDDELFCAPNAQAWKTMVLIRRANREKRAESTFAVIYRQLHDEQSPHAYFDIGIDLPSVSKTVLLTGLHTVIAQIRESKAQGLTFDQRSPINLHLGFKRLYGIVCSPTRSTPISSSSLLMGWHSAYIELLLVEALSSQDLQTAANMPLGMPDICPVADEKMRYTRTALGRRILIHANAIRLAAMSLPFSLMRLPPLFMPAYIYRAGLVFLAYVTGKANEAFNPSAEAFELSTQKDFDDATISSHPAMLPMTYTAYENTSDPVAKRFVTEGGPVTLNNGPLHLDDIACFVTWLRPFGSVFGVASTMADDLESRIQGCM